MASKTQRIFLWLCALTFASVVLVLVALPWVYAWAVPHFLAKEGVRIGSTSHHPFKYLRLHSVFYKDTKAGIEAEVKTVELPALYPFLLGVLSSSAERSTVEASDWRLVLTTPKDDDKNGEPAADSSPPLPPAAQVLEIRNLLHLADPWLSQIDLHRGSVTYAAYQLDLTLISWADGNLLVKGNAPEGIGPFALNLRRQSIPSLGLTADFEFKELDLMGEAKALVPYLNSSTLQATLALQWKGGLAEATANWQGDNRIPDSAALNVNDFPIPPALVVIPNYAQPLISTQISWQQKTGTVRLNGRSESLTVDDPPLDWSLQARINTQGILVNALQMNGPWLNGELSEPIELNWQRLFGQAGTTAASSIESLTGVATDNTEKPTAASSAESQTDATPTADSDSSARSHAAPSTEADTKTAAAPAPEPDKPAGGGQIVAEPVLRLVLDVNLADFPLIPLQGRASGVLSISTDAQGRIQADVSLESTDLSWEKIRLKSLRLQASLRNSVVRLIELDIRAADESYFTGAGSTDLSTRTVERAQFKGKITDQFVKALGSGLPQGEHLEFVVELNGPWTELVHAGQVRFNNIQPGSGSEPFDITLQWQGVELDVPDIKLNAYGENIEAQIEASFLRDETARTDRVTLRAARLEAGKYPAITLEEPSVLTYYEADNTLELTPLKLTSDGQGYLHAFVTLPQGDEPGTVSLHAAQVSARWLEIYRGAQLPCPVGIDAIKADFQWGSNQWLRGTLLLEAHAEPGDLPNVSLTAQAALGQGGLHVRRIHMEQSNMSLLDLTADLPVAIHTNARNQPQLRLLGKESLHVIGELNLANDALSQWLAETFTLELGSLHASLQLGGTASAPRGEAALSMHTFQWKEPPGQLPPLPLIESLQIDGELTPEAINLRSLRALFGNVPLNAAGSLPFPASERRALVQEGKLPSLQKASLSMSTGDLPLQDFSGALPGMLRPMGTVNIEAELKPGFDFSGVFTLKEASTRPLQPIGSIDNINAQLHLKDRILRINRLDAQIGAQPVRIDGSANLEDLEHVVYDLSLQGGDLPIVRSPGLILRAKPQITLKTDDEGITVLAGELELGQSFYTIDLTALTGGDAGGTSAASANNRPPYFSINEPPMADWQLNLRLHGSDFLRIRTPFFEGMVSANFNLRGTLLAPYAFGSAEIDQGVIMFPYASLRVENGSLTLRQDDPYVGRLDMNATGRAYGYDLSMHLTGTADDPTIQFDAAPSLDQSEVLLLLNTGQIPNAPERSAMSRLSGLGMFLGNSVLINLGLVDPLDNRFELLIGEDITEKDQDTITVRYRITDDWSVIGNYDRFDAYNLDLQWTIYRD